MQSRFYLITPKSSGSFWGFYFLYVRLSCVSGAMKNGSSTTPLFSSKQSNFVHTSSWLIKASLAAIKRTHNTQHRNKRIGE